MGKKSASASASADMLEGDVCCYLTGNEMRVRCGLGRCERKGAVAYEGQQQARG